MDNKILHSVRGSDAALEDSRVPEVFVSVFICCLYKKVYFPEVICCAAVVDLQSMYVDLTGAVSPLSCLSHLSSHEEFVHFLSDGTKHSSLSVF